MILTAKHHDGFCLWPTATTGHRWLRRDGSTGKGDVVAALRAACDKYDMKLGLVSVASWDLLMLLLLRRFGAYNDMFWHSCA